MNTTKQSVLVTGGAGYIGSHISYALMQQGYQVIIIDRYDHQQHFYPSWARIIQEDFSNQKVLDQIFKNYRIQAVIHCAGSIEVGLSIKDPFIFYKNNVANTLNLIQTMLTFNVNKFIFSSTCAIYGNPQYSPMDEHHPQNPINPYGKTKQIIENMLSDFNQSYGLQYISLRYFNAAGALPELGLGEQHQPETHIIPLLLHAAREQTPFTLFGSDYETKDGTAIRDYVHVRDIAQAHVLALRHLEQANPSDCFNLGTGRGWSVKEIITAVEKICRQPLKISIEKRRAGDAPVLVADATRARSILRWEPQYSDLEFMLNSAYHFHGNLRQENLIIQPRAI